MRPAGSALRRICSGAADALGAGADNVWSFDNPEEALDDCLGPTGINPGDEPPDDGCERAVA